MLIFKNSKKEIAINNKIQRVHSFESFCKILSDVYDGGKDAITIEVHVLSSTERKEEAMSGIDETISLANEIFFVKTIRYVVMLKSHESNGETSTAELPCCLMVDVLMRKKPTLIILKTLPEKDKIVLHNELIRDMQQKSFLVIQSQDEGHKFFKLLSNALWYLDGRAQTISKTTKKRKNVTAIPNCDTQKVTFFILHFYQNSFVDSSLLFLIYLHTFSVFKEILKFRQIIFSE